MDTQNKKRTALSLEEAKALTKGISLKATVDASIRAKKLTKVRLCQLLGVQKDFLNYALNHKPTIALLLALSSHLDVNLVMIYSRLTPDALHTTTAEMVLQIEIDGMSKEIKQHLDTIEMLKGLIRGK